jgi:hypothetical protein
MKSEVQVFLKEDSGLERRLPVAAWRNTHA